MTTQTKEAFETWWDETGSYAPAPKSDMYEHCKKIALMAWQEALKQEASEQEPDGWYMLSREEDIEGYFTVTKPTRQQKISHEPMALYYYPHQWQGVSDGEILAITLACESFPEAARAIEQALKKKNT